MIIKIPGQMTDHGLKEQAGFRIRKVLAAGKHPVLVACDLQRPAAVEQLAIVGEQVGVPVFRTDGEKNPVRVARNSLPWAVENERDVVIVDTAGRLHIDQEMMKQAADIAKAISPHQIYLVCDWSWTG